MYSSNGLFINGTTRIKDFFTTTPTLEELTKYLEKDEEKKVDYAIIEITAESVKRGDNIHKLPFEIIGLTTFYPNLNHHFNNDKDYYLNCKREILKNQNKILLRYESVNESNGSSYKLFKDLKHISYGYTDSSDKKIEVIENNLDGLSLKYQNVIFKTNLISSYNIRNLALALSILDEINELDMNTFSNFAKNIKIRGRFEKYTINNKTIILDTGQAGLDIVLNSFNNIDIKLIYCNIPDDGTIWTKEARQRAGRQIRKTKKVYLTTLNAFNSNDEEIFKNGVLGNQPHPYIYIRDPNDAVNIALEELEENEILVIITKEKYRFYKQILENIKDKV